MHEIVGIIPFHGHPIHPQWLSLMANGCCQGECQRVWFEQAAALGQVPRTPGRPRVPQGALPERSGLVLAAGARLVNRVELLQELEIPGPEQEHTTDEALVHAACVRWGEDAPRHLLGDWHFALWDGCRRMLLLARDPWGHSGLYYHRNATRLAFASDIRALLALPDVPRRPNLRVVADRLMAWPGDGFATFHDGIMRLPVGHLARIGPERMELSRYWDPQRLAPLRLARDEDYVEAFLHLYQQAVGAGLGEAGTVAATLSGGLDSGSVVALASPLLAAQGRELLAFTSVPSLAREVRPGRFGDEWDLASATARMAEKAGARIRHLPLSCQGTGILASINLNYEIHMDPGHAASNYFWIQELMDQCRLRGMRTLLTGQSGNSSVSWAGTGSLVLPLIRGDLGGMLRALRAEPTPWLALKRQVIRPLITPFRRASSRSTCAHEPWRGFSAVASGFIRDGGILEQMLAEGYDPTFMPRATKDARLRLFTPPRGSFGERWKALGDHYGLVVHDPTRDLRLVEFCLRIPDDQYRRRGQSRWLLRRAMREHMPDCVLDNPARGFQAADIGHRVLLERAGMLEALDRLEASPEVRAILDLPRMRGVLQSLEQGVTPANTSACGSILLRGLSVGLALLRF